MSASWIRTRLAFLKTPRSRLTTPQPVDDDKLTPGELSQADRAAIRRQCNLAGRLRGFSGEAAQHDAYLSGQWLSAMLFGSESARPKRFVRVSYTSPSLCRPRL